MLPVLSQSVHHDRPSRPPPCPPPSPPPPFLRHRSMVVYNGPPIIDSRPLTHLPPLLLMCCSKFSKSRMRIETNKHPSPHVSIIVVSVNHGIPCLNNWLANLCFWEDSIITSRRTSCIYMLISTMCNIVIVIINIIIILINAIINNVEVSISVCEESVLVVTAAPICQNRSQDQIRFHVNHSNPKDPYYFIS